MQWLNVLIHGSLLGGIYALFAIGLSLSFGIMRLVNIAHGDLIILSAYVALVVTQQTGLDPISSLVVVVPVMFELGYAVQRGLLNFTLPGGISIGVYPLLVFVVALAGVASLQLLFYRTGIGRAFRAVSDDADTAELMGIDNRKLYALAFAIAMIFTAVAGVLFAIRTIFDPPSGPI